MEYKNYKEFELKVKCPNCHKENIFNFVDFKNNEIITDYHEFEFTCEHCLKDIIIKII